MNITEKMRKPIPETAYLTAENAGRYRVILRYFYLQYEKIKYWMDQDEVYAELTSHPEFAAYTMDQCKQDLKALVDWNNLLPMQDTKRVTSIEAFKNRQFRYQLTDYTVEIERMAIRLEHLTVEGASLEPTLLERIQMELRKLPEMVHKEAAEVYSWWNSLNHDFIRLNQNYQDYMRDLNGAKAEELMKTREFLVFKDKLIEYLRSFVKGLQMNVGMIEKLLLAVDDATRDLVFQKAVDYETSIPRLDMEVTHQELWDKAKGRWNSMLDWFAGSGGESEASRLFDITNDSIRKITRYAAQISEMHSGGANRKEEYKHLCRMFLSCKDVNEAHCLSAMIFGVERPLHMKGEWNRITDSINSGVYEESPLEYLIKPRIRTYREKAERNQIRDYQKEKEAVKRQEMEKQIKEQKLVSGYIQDGVLTFADLPVLEPEVRDILLRWLSKALESKDRKAKTEDGLEYRIVNPKEQKNCVLSCTDGAFSMPEFVLEFV